MPIINLTDLTVRLADDQDEVYQTFEPDEQRIRLKTQGTSHEVEGVPVEQTFVTSVEGLPEPEDDTFYIVPQPVAYFIDRPDFVVPDTGPSAIREDDGTVYAVHRLFSISRKEDG